MLEAFDSVLEVVDVPITKLAREGFIRLASNSEVAADTLNKVTSTAKDVINALEAFPNDASRMKFFEDYETFGKRMDAIVENLEAANEVGNADILRKNITLIARGFALHSSKSGRFLTRHSKGQRYVVQNTVDLLEDFPNLKIGIEPSALNPAYGLNKLYRDLLVAAKGTDPVNFWFVELKNWSVWRQWSMLKTVDSHLTGLTEDTFTQYGLWIRVSCDLPPSTLQVGRRVSVEGFYLNVATKYEELGFELPSGYKDWIEFVAGKPPIWEDLEGGISVQVPPGKKANVRLQHVPDTYVPPTGQ